MIPIKNKIFSTKVGSKTYFGFDKTIYLVENKQVKPVEEIPEEVENLDLVESAKDNIVENEASYVYMDENGDEFEAYKETKEVLKNGEEIPMTESMNPRTTKILSGLLELESTEILENEETGEEEINVDGVDDTITIDEETDEPVIAEEESPESIEATEAQEADEAETGLILEKIDELNDNISKLEDIDMSDRDDVQDIYIQEMGKVGILKKRLDELGYEQQETGDNVVDKLLESYSYPELAKVKVKAAILTECKFGTKVLNHVVGLSRTKFLESINEEESYEVGDVKIDHNKGDSEYVMTGGISELSEEEILVVDEAGLIENIDKLANMEVEEEVTENVHDKLLPKLNIKEKLAEVLGTDEPVELVDNEMYKTKCDLYGDNFSEAISPIMTDDSYLKMTENNVLKYNKENNVFLDESNNQYNLDAKFVESFEGADVGDMEKGAMFENVGTGRNVKLMEIDESGVLPTYLFENSSGEFASLETRQIPFYLRKKK